MREHWFDELARETARSQSRRALLQRLGRGLAGALLAAAGVGAGRAAEAKGTGTRWGGTSNYVACFHKCTVAEETCTLGCLPLDDKLKKAQEKERAAQQAYHQASCDTPFGRNHAVCLTLTAILAEAAQEVQADKSALQACAVDCLKKEKHCVKACNSR